MIFSFLFNVDGKKLRDILFEKISGEVEVENLGPVAWALKTNILRDRVAGILKITQEAYVNELLEKYGIDPSKNEWIPTHDNLFLPSVGETETKIDESLKKKFQAQIGALWWLTSISRPDIFYAVHRCSKIQNQPNLRLGKCLEKILMYLGTTKILALFIIENLNHQSYPGYVDASFATEDEAYSRVGYFYLFKGNLVSWVSENPSRVMTSSTEAECRGLVQIAKENIWQRQMHNELNLFPFTGPTVVYEDNKAAITMSNNPGVPHKRSKFFGIEFAFFKQSVELGEIQPEYVPTELQPADMLTKTLPRPKFSLFRDMMMGGEQLQTHFEKKEQHTEKKEKEKKKHERQHSCRCEGAENEKMRPNTSQPVIILGYVCFFFPPPSLCVSLLRECSRGENFSTAPLSLCVSLLRECSRGERQFPPFFSRPPPPLSLSVFLC